MLLFSLELFVVTVLLLFLELLLLLELLLSVDVHAISPTVSSATQPIDTKTLLIPFI